MGESFEGNDKKPGQNDSFSAHAINEVLQGLADLDDKIARTAGETVDSTINTSGGARVAVAVGKGVFHGLTDGLAHAVKYSVAHPVEFATKMGTAYLAGMVMRRYLPEQGVTKALAGTLMLGYMAYDGAKPIWQGSKEAYNAKDMAGVDRAAEKMSKGIGLFAFDSITGCYVGMRGERRMANYLKSSRGPAGYLTFEQSRDAFWNADGNPLNKGLKRIASTLDSACDKAAEAVRPKEIVAPTLSFKEQKDAVVSAARKGAQNIEDSVFWRLGQKETVPTDPPPVQGGFYRQGSLDANGKRIGYSETINAQLGDKAHEADWAAVKLAGEVKPANPAAALTPEAGELAGKAKVAKIAGDVFPEPVDVKAPGDGSAGTPPTTPAVKVSPENEGPIFDKLSAEAKKRQEAWDPLQIGIADYQDAVKGPLWGVIDKDRKVPLYDPIYERPNRQLIDIANQIKTKEDVEYVGQLLNDHASAALQSELGVPLVRRLNITGEDYMGILIDGMKQAGIKKPLFDGVAVTKFSVGGTDNYTQPHIFGTVDGSVTKFPRSQVELRGPFQPINAHEVYGHNALFPTLAKFTDEQVKTVIGGAVDAAMKEAQIPLDAKILVPGAGEVPVKTLFTKILIAQRNENTSDIGGTGVTVLGTPDSLTVLLKSLRAGGKLETRSVYGQKFGNDVFEAHGVDRWRLLVSAETVRQRAKHAGGDKELESLALELEEVANLVSRQGDNYVFASTDKKGDYFAIPRKWWDPVAKHLVKAQLETPLQALEGKSLNDILPNMPATWKRISFLADQMVESASKGKDNLLTPFNKEDFRPFEVSTATLLAWKRATAKGQDEAKSLDHINLMWDSLMAQYENGNPFSVGTAPSAIRRFTQEPMTITRRGIANSFGLQKAAREHTDRQARRYGSMAATLMMGDLIHRYTKENQLDQ
jgi:hypothetical protein